MSSAMNRFMMFTVMLAIALLLGGYNAKATATVFPPNTKAYPASVAQLKCIPTVPSSLFDAENTDDFPTSGLYENNSRSAHAPVAAIEPILETRKAEAYTLPMFIVQHRLLI